jgi:2-haloacid dehalogenase
MKPGKCQTRSARATWPDAVEGLARLKEKYVLATLSNGNVSLLSDMAKSAGLPWDVVLSAELVPSLQAGSRGAADLLGCKPAELMMVAAHPSDLQAAQACGLHTAFVPRPLEHGPGKADAPPSQGFDRFDIVARDFLELAAKMAYSAR